ncbi:hypothetical protein TNCV_4267921 [Trichonephila clavipes]|nr:hypothetical protein TNCV_4267921 [Trichonephila clavipes]
MEWQSTRWNIEGCKNTYASGHRGSLRDFPHTTIPTYLCVVTRFQESFLKCNAYRMILKHGSRWLRIRYTCFEEMEGKSCAWVEDDVVTAVGILVLRLDDSGARHILESDEWGCKQLIHLGSRLQSVEACPTDAHLEQ